MIKNPFDVQYGYHTKNGEAPMSKLPKLRDSTLDSRVNITLPNALLTGRLTDINLWTALCPPKSSCAEVLIPSTLACDCIWRQDPKRGN